MPRVVSCLFGHVWYRVNAVCNIVLMQELFSDEVWRRVDADCGDNFISSLIATAYFHLYHGPGL